MGNQQEFHGEPSQDFAGITKRWWDGSHDWSAKVEEYRVFRKGKMGRRGGRVAL